MGWLAGWMKELVIIVIIASFIDLLLPSHGFQRYVKSVVGLFILLVMLSPVFQFFHRKWNADELIQAAALKQNSAGAVLQPITEIMQKSAELQMQNQSQANQLLQQQLAAKMKGDIEHESSAIVTDIHVNTQVDAKGNPFIKNVVITLAKLNPADQVQTEKMSSNSQSTVKLPQLVPIETIAPIEISIAPIVPSTQMPSLKKPVVTAETSNNKAIALIDQYFAEQWQLKANQIQIHLN